MEITVRMKGKAMAELKRRAEYLKAWADEELKNAGMFFPRGARLLLEQQAALIVDLAAAVERVEALIDIGPGGA